MPCLQPTGLTADITPAALELQNVNVHDKVYDGSTNATLDLTTAVFQGKLTADDLTLSHAAAVFSDKNVGNLKTVNLSGITLGGVDATNYRLLSDSGVTHGNILRLNSVAWTGGSVGNWFDRANWRDGAVPDLSNVANVSLPAGVEVNFNTTQIAPAEQGAVHLDSLTSQGRLNLQAGELNIGSGGVTLADFNQSGGKLTSQGDFNVSTAFSQSATGEVNITGQTIINDNAGGVLLGNLSSAGGLKITSTGGGILQVAGTALQVNGAANLLAYTVLPNNPANIELLNPGNDFVGPVSLNGARVALNDSNRLVLQSVNAETLAITSHGDLTLGNIFVRGDLGLHTTQGNISQQGPIIALGTSTIDTQAGSVLLNHPGNVLNFPGSPEDPTPQTPPTSTTKTETVVIAGHTLQLITTNQASGQQTQTLVFAPSANSSNDSPAVTLPLVTDAQGQALLEINLPANIGISATKQNLGQSQVSNLAQTLINLTQAHVSSKELASIIDKGINTYTATVKDEAQVTVRQITFNAPTTNTLAQPVIINGALGAGEDNIQHPFRQEALIIDARQLPANSVIQLDNIEFAIVLGQVTLNGGQGRNIVIGDDAAQFIMLGSADDILHGLGGNDVLGSRDGNDKIYGDDGNDQLAGGEDNDHLEGGAGNDVLQGGLPDQGQWHFSFNRNNVLQTQLTSSFAPVANARYDINLSLLDRYHSDLQFLKSNPNSLVTTSLLYQAVTQKPMTDIKLLNQLTTSAYSDQQLANMALDYLKTLPGYQQLDNLNFSQILVNSMLGRSLAPTEQSAIVQYFNQGGTRAEGLLYLSHLPEYRMHLNANSELTLLDYSNSGRGWFAQSGNDTLLGGPGNDVFIADDGQDVYQGGEGMDTLIIGRDLAQFSVQHTEGSHEWQATFIPTGEQMRIQDIETVIINDTSYKLN